MAIEGSIQQWGRVHVSMRTAGEIHVLVDVGDADELDLDRAVGRDGTNALRPVPAAGG